jgi:hypothetical protein
VTVPLLAFSSGERIVIHGVPFDGVQVHPTRVVTGKELVAGSGPCVALFVASAKLHGAPICVTVKSCPAMLTTPVRDSAVELLWTL